MSDQPTPEPYPAIATFTVRVAVESPEEYEDFLATMREAAKHHSRWSVGAAGVFTQEEQDVQMSWERRNLTDWRRTQEATAAPAGCACTERDGRRIWCTEHFLDDLDTPPEPHPQPPVSGVWSDAERHIAAVAETLPDDTPFVPVEDPAQTPAGTLIAAELDRLTAQDPAHPPEAPDAA